MMIDQYILALISVCSGEAKMSLFLLPELSATRSRDSKGSKAAEVLNDHSGGRPMRTYISGNLDYALFGVPGQPGELGETTECDTAWSKSILCMTCCISTQLLTAPSN